MKLHDEIRARAVDQKTLNGWELAATAAGVGVEYCVYFDPAAALVDASFVVVSCPAGPTPVAVRERDHAS